MFRVRVLLFVLAAMPCAGWATRASAAAPPPAQRFRLLSTEEAWRRLPRPEPPLPAWARALAGSLPRTTAAMLELDRLHRAGNPLGPVLAATLRWAAADELGCDYARRHAWSDLRRAGVSDKERNQLRSGRDLSAPRRAAVNFARKLTRAGHTVTDDEVAELIEHFGAEKVVAMVHTIALANFQGRIFLALGIAVEAGGPLPPLDVHLDPRKGFGVVLPDRPKWGVWRKTQSSRRIDLPASWQEKSAGDLATALEQQKRRKARIPLPGPDRLARIPPEAKAQASRVVWTRVSMGYQPGLTSAWFNCMRLFYQESRMDRVFCNSYFWVITRTNECFYCMGHSEMLLAVAGLKPDEIKTRTEKLAGGDWSAFPPAERLAFAFAHKLAKKPSALTDGDVHGLIDTFGRARALDLIWYGAWCNYMTRVADAFGLPLERENVFATPAKEKGDRDRSR